MSSIIVEVAKIDKIAAHGNADKLELAQIRGWQVVVPKGKYQPGNLVVYIPPDCVLPQPLSDKLGITKYLSNGRVRCAKLRGEPSFGVILDAEDPAWVEGTQVHERYGITKYVPPIKTSQGDAEANHPLFSNYTEIENMRNFPTVFQDGEEVVATEKIHGSCCKCGRIEGQIMAGSKGLRRKRPADDQMATHLYWFPYTLPPVRALVDEFCPTAKQIILFGEVYGKVQSLRYGLPGQIGFRAFDLMVDGKYLDNDAFRDACAQYGVDTVPVIYRGPFSLDQIRKVSDGPSTMPGADHIREGVVVRPVKERIDPKIGRVVLKYVGDGYLFGNHSDAEDV